MVEIAQKDIDIKCGVGLVSSLSHRHNIYIALSIMYQVYSNGRRALVHLAIRGYMIRLTTETMTDTMMTTTDGDGDGDGDGDDKTDLAVEGE